MRVAALANDQVIVSETVIDDGRILETRKTPREGGGCVGVVSDITARKKAEEALRESEERSKAILNTAFQLQGLLRPDGTVIETNTAALAMIGATREDVVGLKFWDCPWWTHDAEIQERLRKAVDQAARGETVQFLTIHITPDGSARNIDFRVTPARGESGDVIFIVPEGHDVTDLKRAEERLAAAHELITSSIDYASNIQRSALPPDDLMSEALGEHFVIWQPRDVVGGDIYWVRRIEGGHIVVIADCTGHGVPGAFLTMIATGALRQAIIEHPDGDPAAIIGRMNTFIKNSLRQDTAEGPSDDRLELGICRIDEGRERLTFAGARFSLWTLDGEGAEEVKGDKSGIGYHHVPSDRAFTNHDVPLSPDSTYYLFSDGLVDQVGGDKRRAFGKKRIIALLDAHKDRPIAERGAAVMREFEAYQGTEIRRDDVTMLGFVPVV